MRPKHLLTSASVHWRAWLISRAHCADRHPSSPDLSRRRLWSQNCRWKQDHIHSRKQGVNSSFCPPPIKLLLIKAEWHFLRNQKSPKQVNFKSCTVMQTDFFKDKYRNQKMFTWPFVRDKNAWMPNAPVSLGKGHVKSASVYFISIHFHQYPRWYHFTH